MKHILLAGLVVLLAGCGRAQPTLAHGKPVSDWVAALQHPDARQRKKAAEVLGNVGAADPAVVPALAGAVKDRDPTVRGGAVVARLKRGRAAGGAGPPPQEAEKARAPRARANAVRAREKARAGP